MCKNELVTPSVPLEFAVDMFINNGSEIFQNLLDKAKDTGDVMTLIAFAQVAAYTIKYQVIVEAGDGKVTREEDESYVKEFLHGLRIATW